MNKLIAAVMFAAMFLAATVGNAQKVTKKVDKGVKTTKDKVVETGKKAEKGANSAFEQGKSSVQKTADKAVEEAGKSNVIDKTNSSTKARGDHKSVKDAVEANKKGGSAAEKMEKAGKNTEKAGSKAVIDAGAEASSKTNVEGARDNTRSKLKNAQSTLQSSTTSAKNAENNVLKARLRLEEMKSKGEITTQEYDAKAKQIGQIQEKINALRVSISEGTKAVEVGSSLIQSAK